MFCVKFNGFSFRFFPFLFFFFFFFCFPFYIFCLVFLHIFLPFSLSVIMSFFCSLLVGLFLSLTSLPLGLISCVVIGVFAFVSGMAVSVNVKEAGRMLKGAENETKTAKDYIYQYIHVLVVQMIPSVFTLFVEVTGIFVGPSEIENYGSSFISRRHRYFIREE